MPNSSSTYSPRRRSPLVNMPNQIQNLHTVDKDTFPYVFEQNASVTLKSSDGLIRLNVYRPKTEEKVPVLVTYGP